MADRPTTISVVTVSIRIGPFRNDRLVKKAVYQIVVSTPVTPNSATKMRFLLPG